MGEKKTGYLLAGLFLLTYYFLVFATTGAGRDLNSGSCGAESERAAKAGEGV